MTAATELEYVGFWPRVLASIVDIVLSAIVLAPLGAMMFGGYPVSFDDGFRFDGGMEFWRNHILPAGAVIVFWIVKNATPGKMLVRARIVDAASGDTPRPSQYLIRYLGYYLSMIPLFLGFVWIAFDARKQGWHDKLAGTVVVRPRNGGAEPVRFERKDAPAA